MFNNKSFEDYNEYDELEKVYKKRKTKKYLYGGIVALIAIVGGYLIVSNTSTGNTSKTTSEQKPQKVITGETSTPKKTNLEEKTDNKNNKNEQTEEKGEKNKLTLNPIIPEVNNVESETKREKEFKKPEEVKEVKKEEKKESAKESKKEKNTKIVIKVRTDDYSLKELIDNYNSFPTYETAIRIAKIYFNNGRYEDAIDWAKKANNIDAKKEESWLIYAKSLVNLGNVKTAKKLLNAYLNIYGKNKKVEEYLRTLK